MIIDSPPVGLVSDALLIEKYVDLTLYVVRENYTYKSQLNLVNNLRAYKKIRNIFLVMNDIKVKSPAYYGYGYNASYSEPAGKRMWYLGR